MGFNERAHGGIEYYRRVGSDPYKLRTSRPPTRYGRIARILPKNDIADLQHPQVRRTQRTRELVISFEMLHPAVDDILVRSKSGIKRPDFLSAVAKQLGIPLDWRLARILNMYVADQESKRKIRIIDGMIFKISKQKRKERVSKNVEFTFIDSLSIRTEQRVMEEITDAIPFRQGCISVNELISIVRKRLLSKYSVGLDTASIYKVLTKLTTRGVLHQKDGNVWHAPKPRR